jgi:hypothetical protein
VSAANALKTYKSAKAVHRLLCGSMEGRGLQSDRRRPHPCPVHLYDLLGPVLLYGRRGTDVLKHLGFGRTGGHSI